MTGPNDNTFFSLQDQALQRQLIAELIQNWVIWRDAGDWSRFRTLWHPGGRMIATWFQGGFEEFIAANQQAFAQGVRILHFLGGSSIEIQGDRAIAQTKVMISQRAKVHGIECDVLCVGRFYDFFERRAGSWGYILRQPIYEKDRLDPVDPGIRLQLDEQRLQQYPEGYQHLAYLQAGIGQQVTMTLPGLTGERVEELYAAGKSWLNGDALSWVE